MKIDGACHCGAIQYQAEIDPENVVLCHCTDCQTLSGATFRTVVQTLPGTFQLIVGVPKIYVKTGESGNKREQTFCGDCGTPIFSAPVGTGDRAVALRVGSIRQRNRLVPKKQYWCRSEQTWLADLAGITKEDTQPVFGTDGSFTR